MQIPRVVGRIVLVLWFLLGVLSCFFAQSQGLGYLNADNPFGISYVSELQSSGANDNICIEVGVVLAVAGMVWGIIRLKAKSGVVDFAINLILLSLQALFIAAIEVGSLYVTVVVGKNIVLALWIIAYGLLWILLLLCFRWGGRLLFA